MPKREWDENDEIAAKQGKSIERHRVSRPEGKTKFFTRHGFRDLEKEGLEQVAKKLLKRGK